AHNSLPPSSWRRTSPGIVGTTPDRPCPRECTGTAAFRGGRRKSARRREASPCPPRRVVRRQRNGCRRRWRLGVDGGHVETVRVIAPFLGQLAVIHRTVYVHHRSNPGLGRLVRPSVVH